MERIKVDILIACHKRHKIVESCMEGLEDTRRLFSEIYVDVHVICAVDDHQMADLVRHYGCRAVWIDNEPLGARMNDMIDYTRIDCDYIMQLGSDDIIDKSGVYALGAFMHNQIAAFGFQSCYVINTVTGACKVLPSRMVIGAGRCYRRDIIDECIERTGKVWDDNKMRGLDGNSQANIHAATGCVPRVVHTGHPAIFDLKSDVNLWKYDDIGGKEIAPRADWPDEVLKYTGVQ